MKTLKAIYDVVFMPVVMLFFALSLIALCTGKSFQCEMHIRDTSTTKPIGATK